MPTGYSSIFLPDLCVCLRKRSLPVIRCRSTWSWPHCPAGWCPASERSPAAVWLHDPPTWSFLLAWSCRGYSEGREGLNPHRVTLLLWGHVHIDKTFIVLFFCFPLFWPSIYTKSVFLTPETETFEIAGLACSLVKPLFSCEMAAFENIAEYTTMTWGIDHPVHWSPA